MYNRWIETTYYHLATYCDLGLVTFELDNFEKNILNYEGP